MWGGWGWQGSWFLARRSSCQSQPSTYQGIPSIPNPNCIFSTNKTSKYNYKLNTNTHRFPSTTASFQQTKHKSTITNHTHQFPTPTASFQQTKHKKIKYRYIARVQNCPDIKILNSLFCLSVFLLFCLFINFVFSAFLSFCLSVFLYFSFFV